MVAHRTQCRHRGSSASERTEWAAGSVHYVHSQMSVLPAARSLRSLALLPLALFFSCVGLLSSPRSSRNGQ